MNTKTQQILLHIAGWMVFLSLPLLFSPESLSLRAYLTNPPTQRDLLSYGLILAVFYLNVYWLIPRFYFRKQYLAFLLIGLGCFIITVYLPPILIRPGNIHPGFFDKFGSPGHPPSDWFSGRPAPPPGDTHFAPPPLPRHSFFIDLSQHVFLFLGMMVLALMLKIRERWKQTEKEKLQTELSYLKAQINPHFLFNSLNSIYALAIEKSDHAPAAIVLLSDMMRYVLDESGREWVSLDKEIHYIRSYIALQETRFGHSMHLDFQVIDQLGDSSIGKYHIAPLILIPFIENAFKHGVNAEENSDIHIRIDLKDASLHLMVINNKVMIKQATQPHSGLGIDNTKKRLQLLYPRDHKLEIHNQAHDFQVSLTLRLI